MTTKRPLDRDHPPLVKPPGTSIIDALGPDSPAFRAAMAKWQSRIEAGAGADCLREWREAASAYTNGPLDRELFLRQTFIGLAARLAAAVALAGSLDSLPDGELRLVARGTWFRQQGIDGFDQAHDLFGWPDSDVIFRAMADALDDVNLPACQSDVLKRLHHAISAIESRRPLGEIYTPDWLASWIVEDVIDVKDVIQDGIDGPILDPACGSGTFLFHAIRRLTEVLPSTAETLETLVTTVHGADVNPIAVEMSRANTLLALGPLLRLRTGRIRPRVERRDALARGDWDRIYRVVIGNPPWAPLRAAPSARQARLKQLAAALGLNDGRGEMTTHLELALIFLAHCGETALRPGGRLAFVVPRTVFTAAQHHALRAGALKLRIDRILDFERVTPLFNTPAAVLYCRKQKRDIQAEIPVTTLSGRLPGHESSLVEARRCLSAALGCLRLHQAGRRSWWSESTPNPDSPSVSPYKGRFRQGATLVPRPFWFVDVAEPAPGCPAPTRFVKSSSPGKGGPVAAYREVRLAGSIEHRFLFQTVLGDDLLPFAARRFRTVALPAIMDDGRLRMLGVAELMESGWNCMASWLAEAERIWTHERGEKAAKMTLLQRLDHVRGLTAQRPSARWRVLYPNFQRVSVACIIDTQGVAGTAERPGFVVDTAFYCCETDDEMEAGYLCAVLNSKVIDEALGPLRRGDQAAHPNVHKKIFDAAPIPLYDFTNERHLRLASVAKECAIRVESLLTQNAELSIGRVGDVRRVIRETLASQLAEIDSLTAELLGRPAQIP